MHKSSAPPLACCPAALSVGNSDFLLALDCSAQTGAHISVVDLQRFVVQNFHLVETHNVELLQSLLALEVHHLSGLFEEKVNVLNHPIQPGNYPTHLGCYQEVQDPYDPQPLEAHRSVEVQILAEGHDSTEKEHSEVHRNSGLAEDSVAAHNSAVEKDPVVVCSSVEVAEHTVVSHSSVAVEDTLVGHSSAGVEDPVARYNSAVVEDPVLHHNSAVVDDPVLAHSSAEEGDNCLVDTVGLFEACYLVFETVEEVVSQ